MLLVLYKYECEKMSNIYIKACKSIQTVGWPAVMFYGSVRFRIIRLLPVSMLENASLPLQKWSLYSPFFFDPLILYIISFSSRLFFGQTFSLGGRVGHAEKNSSFKTRLMTPSTLGDNQWHVGLMWWLTGFSNSGGQWVHLQTGLKENS